MTGAEDPIRRRMASLSDEQLRHVLTDGRDDWQPEALEVARQELVRRGVAVPELDDPRVIAQPREVIRNGLGALILVLLFLKLIAIFLR